MYKVVSGCRSCGSTSLETFLSLGEAPLANGLLEVEGLRRPEPRYPLDVAFCMDCSLAQILATVQPEVLFSEDFPYYSSFSDTLLDHSRKSAERLISTRNLDAESLVVEVGSNDGYMLQYFVKEGVPVLGIDPASGPADSARQRGIPTLCTFFGKDLAGSLRDEGLRADLVVANNVMAHVADLNGFVEGICIILKDDGLGVIEVHYVRDLIEHCEFDTIYHEHHCYFSVTSLVPLFERHGLRLNAVEHLPIHGGSLRLFVGFQNKAEDSVSVFLQDESSRGMTEAGYYRDFASRVQGTRDYLAAMFKGFKEEGKRIAAYGAAAKGAMLLNYLGLGKETVEFVVDRNVHKQGLYMPGAHVPICEPAKLLEEMPDYVLLLTWNLKEEILGQQAEYRHRGGKFIVPIPHPVLV